MRGCNHEFAGVVAYYVQISVVWLAGCFFGSFFCCLHSVSCVVQTTIGLFKIKLLLLLSMPIEYIVLVVSGVPFGAHHIYTHAYVRNIEGVSVRRLFEDHLNTLYSMDQSVCSMFTMFCWLYLSLVTICRTVQFLSPSFLQSLCPSPPPPLSSWSFNLIRLSECMGFVYIPVELVQNIMKRINSNALRTFMSLQAVSRSLRFPILFAIFLNVYKYICYSVGYMLSVCAGCVLFSFLFPSLSLSL